jgi:hypothetical protein
LLLREEGSRKSKQPIWKKTSSHTLVRREICKVQAGVYGLSGPEIEVIDGHPASHIFDIIVGVHMIQPS